MSLRTPDLAVEIAVANMDLYPIDLPGRPDWDSDLEQLLPYLEKTGCQDFEIHPTEAIMADIAARESRGDTELIARVIGSVHQTFNNGGSDLLGKIATNRGVHRIQESVASMGAIARALGRRIPGVYYPNDLPEDGIPPDDPTFKVMQPSAEVYRDFHIYSDTDLLLVMSRLGIQGLCPDTVHARRHAEDGTPPPAISKVWAAQFASGYVYQMHVGADRVDMGVRDPELAAKSQQEFKAFTSRRWQDARDTEMGEMITAAIESWVSPTDLVMTVGRPILRQVIEIPPRPQAVLHRIRDHARFAENLAELAREAGATPTL